MIETTWSLHRYDVPECTHQPDARYDYRLVERPLLEKEHWRGVGDIISGDRFADDAYRTWASSQMKAMESDIASATEHIQRLERHRARLQRDLSTLSSSLAPVRTLPQDVLLEVFTCLVREHGSTSRAEAAPWILLKVCHQWRQVALSSISLWSSIMITKKCWYPPSKTHSAPLLVVLGLTKHSLSSSRQAPLSVSVDLYGARGSVLQFNKAVINLLVAHRSRIRSLIFYAASYSMRADSERSEANDAITTAFFDVENACPMLKELDMLGPGECRAQVVAGCAPNLTRLRDLILHTDERQPSEAFLNPTVTHFSCYVSAVDNIAILHHLPLLNELHIFVAPGVMLPKKPGPTLHPRVQYFSATRSDILDFLTLPSLRVLTITTTEHMKLSSETTARHIKSFITRSKCMIRTVVLSDAYVQNVILDVHGLHGVHTIALYTGYRSGKGFAEALKNICSSVSLPNLARLIILSNVDLSDHRFQNLHKTLKEILDSSKHELVGKIKVIEIWASQAATGESDLSQLFARFDVNSDGRRWIHRTYSDFSVNELSPPIEGGMWRWMSDIIPSI